MLQSQLFNLLCDKADDKYGGSLPVHVRVICDEFANIGQIPQFDKLNLHRTVYSEMKNIISIFACRMTVRVWLFRTDRRDRSRILSSYHVEGLIRKISTFIHLFFFNEMTKLCRLFCTKLKMLFYKKFTLKK